jgi:cytochrome c oxidase cbb3-type subunit 3/ubiquinol-cytochrome c reductase cytochrome c subunit
MISKSTLLVVALLAAVMCGCDESGGRQRASMEVGRPEDEIHFTTLYTKDCAGCHGENGRNGAAIDLANPAYQALVDDISMRKWITQGLPGSLMTAFGTAAGGVLTNRQIDVLVDGMRKAWSRPGLIPDQRRPSYLQKEVGDSQRGERIFASKCGLCHRSSRQEITSPAYLALVNDQSLRSIIIAGRADTGHPGWRTNASAAVISEQDVADIVAYLGSLRSPTPGQSYPPNP